MEIRKYLFLFLVFLLCEEIEEEYQREPVIFGILNPGKEIQLIKVDTTYNIKDSVYKEGVSNAVVRVFTQDTCIEFKEIDFSGMYIAQKGAWLSPLYRYRLEVVMPYHDTITAETKVPSQIKIISPQNYDTVFLDSSPPPLVWNSVKNKFMYLVYAFPFYPDTTWIDSLPLTSLMPLGDTADTVMPVFEIGKNSLFKLRDTLYIIRVFAIDENYFNYIYYDSTNLSKGYGTFCGLSEDSVKVYVK